MTKPIDDINQLLANQAKQLLSRELSSVRVAMCCGINALGANYGSFTITLHSDGKEFNVSSYHVVEELFSQLEQKLLPAYTNKHINEFVAQVHAVKGQLDQLQELTNAEQ